MKTKTAQKRPKKLPTIIPMRRSEVIARIVAARDRGVAKTLTGAMASLVIAGDTIDLQERARVAKESV